MLLKRLDYNDALCELKWAHLADSPVVMSASGHLQTFAGSKRMSALPSKADILALLELRQLRAVGGLVHRSKEALFTL
jgi:hypothetical protein